MLFHRRFRLRAPDDGGGGGGAAVAAPAAAPAAPAAAPVSAPAPTPGASPAPAPGAAPSAPAAPDGFWNAGWRERLAGGDEKTLAQLSRYASPEAIWQKARALEQRVSAGELKPVLPKNAKPEEVAAYREAMGIPAEAKAYDLKGVQIDEADQPLISHVLAAAHGANATTEQVKAIVGVWPKLKADALAAQTEADGRKRTEAEDNLRAEWGPEFRRNMGLVHQLLDGTGDATTKDAILNGRLADGTPIGSSPAALKMLLGVALKDNPSGTVVPGGSGDPAATIQSEIDKIETSMRTNREAYNKDEKMQERYRNLLQARDQHKKRA